MTQSIDNSEWVMQGVIRDPISGALMRVNADGSINVSIAGGAGAGTGFTSASTAGTALAGTLGTNGLSLGVPAWLTAAAGGGAGTGFTSTTTAGTAVVGTLNSNGLSLGVPAYLTTARGSTDAIGLNTAGTNITWTANSSGLSINAAGYAGTGTTFTNVTATLNSVGLQLNAAGYAGTTTAVTGNASITLNSGGLQFNGSGLVGTNTGATGNLSITANSSGISISQPALVTISNYENYAPAALNTNVGLNGASVSVAIYFQLPQYGSFSFMRLPVGMNTSSTTFATTGASANVGATVKSSWNLAIYSFATGANSQSLTLVTSTQVTQQMVNSISVAANGTQYSVTQSYVYFRQGASSVLTTQYSISNTNYSLTTNQIATNFAGAAFRYSDMPFAASLTPGPYWMVYGFSSSSGVDSTGFTAMTNCNAGGFGNWSGNQQNNNGIWLMGDASSDAAAQSYTNFGVGSFSTAGGGTTGVFNVTKISSIGNNPRPYFQFQRSA